MKVVSKSAVNILNRQAPLPAVFLNCYEVTNPTGLEWSVRAYTVKRVDGRASTHDDRSAIKDVIWKLRAHNSAQCPGYSFVVDLNPETVVTTDRWDIPVPSSYGDYEVTAARDYVASGTDASAQRLVSAILRDGLKHYLKRNTSEELGPLWQEYNSFCQSPRAVDDGEESGSVCRKFELAVKVLRGGRFAIEVIIGSAIIDGVTLADYYQGGRVALLADMIRAKRLNKMTRQGRPAGVRVIRQSPSGYEVKALELEDADAIIRHAELSPSAQAGLASGTAPCFPYGRPVEDIPLTELRLILDTQITQEDHSDTILDPDARECLMRQMRDFVNGADIFGQPLFVSVAPFDAASLRRVSVRPPAIRVRGENGVEEVIKAPSSVTEDALRRRAKKRSEHVRRYGFLQQRPINPLLAWTRNAGEQPADRLVEDFNRILSEKGIRYTFTLFRYDTVEDIKKEIEQNEYDALLAVLPEGWKEPYHDNDTHEQIKRRIQVPSQCIHFNSTLSTDWTRRSIEDLEEKNSRLARRIRQRYELCIGGLLVKHHWVPFAPAEPFNYNVQIGLDVGGRDNTDVVSCFGYGFRVPHEGLLFRPDKIPVTGGKAEPIPQGSLYKGLLEQFETMYSQLTDAGMKPDFETVLFHRDGRLLGDGDRWNERQDLERLHADLRGRGWIGEASVWTVAEISKDAEGWRVFGNQGRVDNPVAGECIFPFDDERAALVCTTGSPYVTQGTACPLMVRVIDVHGSAESDRVIRDVVWGADMCFTKPDMGMRLPWVLYVADRGALQLSRSYKITGVTAS